MLLRAGSIYGEFFCTTPSFASCRFRPEPSTYCDIPPYRDRLGVVQMLAASAPYGGGDVKMYGDQAYRDMAQGDDFAHLLLQKEIEVS